MSTSLSPQPPEIQMGRRSGAVVPVAILLLAGLFSVLHSISKPFWYDEVSTVDICRLQGPREIWKALGDAIDSMPPAFYMIERGARLIVPEDHLGYRTPSILGLLCTILCVYSILSKRGDSLAALLGGASVLCTSLPYYASEARSYGFFVASISLAALAWQRIDDSKLWWLALTSALACAQSIHYYAVLAWPAFILAEASVWYFHRRLRAGVWAALLVGALPLVLFSKLVLQFRAYYGKGFWAQPKLSHAIIDYDTIFNTAQFEGWIVALGLTIAVGYLLFSSI